MTTFHVQSKDYTELDSVLKETVGTINRFSFEIQEDKVQLSCPWTYLGLQLHDQTIMPQQLIIKDDPKTLHDLQQLCGSINWVCPLLGITTDDLAPLFSLLRGSSYLTSPWTITPKAQESIVKVQEVLSSQEAQ